MIFLFSIYLTTPGNAFVSVMSRAPAHLTLEFIYSENWKIKPKGGVSIPGQFCYKISVAAMTYISFKLNYILDFWMIALSVC